MPGTRSDEGIRLAILKNICNEMNPKKDICRKRVKLCKKLDSLTLDLSRIAMRTIAETPEIFAEIKRKALENSVKNNTYGTKSEFDLGKGVITFEERCQIWRHLGVKPSEA